MITMIMDMAKGIRAGTEAAIDFTPHCADNYFVIGAEEDQNYE